MTPARYILLLSLVCLFALIGVAQRSHVVHLGRTVSDLESQRDQLAESNRKLLCEISALSDSPRIREEVKRLNIALLDPVELTKEPESDRRSEPTRRTNPVPHR